MHKSAIWLPCQRLLEPVNADETGGGSVLVSVVLGRGRVEAKLRRATWVAGGAPARSVRGWQRRRQPAPGYAAADLGGPAIVDGGGSHETDAGVAVLMAVLGLGEEAPSQFRGAVGRVASSSGA